MFYLILEEFSVGSCDGHLGETFETAEDSVPHVHRQSVFEIENARLTHILQFRTRLTHFSAFVSGTRTRLPPEHCKRTFTDLTHTHTHTDREGEEQRVVSVSAWMRVYLMFVRVCACVCV